MSAGTINTAPAADQGIDLPQLERTLRSPRTLFSWVMSVIAGVMTLIAVIPLVSVLVMLVWHGAQRLGPALFTELPPAAGMPGGGIGNALLGTILIVALTAVISVPVGVLAALYLAEYAPYGRTAAAVRFAARVLTGLPSILAGIFAYTTIVLTTHTPSAPAAAVALFLLMLPTVLLTAEEAIRSVPKGMREAAYGLGATQTQAVWYVILPAALPGILTGVMLGIARVAGETAPLLFTALFSDYWFGPRFFQEPTPSLAVLIYNFSGSPFPNQIDIAWSASLVLVLIVLAFNLTGQVLAYRMGK